MLNNNKISGIYILTNPVINKWPNRFVYMLTFWPSQCFELWCFMIVIIINFIFCPNIIYFCSVKLNFSISYKEFGFKIITISWNIAISCIYEWINCNIMLNYNKISGIYILTNPVIYKWPNRFVYMLTFWPSQISEILFITQYLNVMLVDNEVSHSVEITSWIRYLSFFTV
jgi:hypothetical protein